MIALEPTSDRIGPHHCARKAILYVCQSSAQQAQQKNRKRPVNTAFPRREALIRRRVGSGAAR